VSVSCPEQYCKHRNRSGIGGHECCVGATPCHTDRNRASGTTAALLGAVALQDEATGQTRGIGAAAAHSTGAA